MAVPGSNLLARAFRLIGQQPYTYYKFISRSKAAQGLFVAKYATGVPTKGSIQPVPRVMYEKLQLDLQKNYYNLYVTRSILDVERDVSGDAIRYGGITFQCESVTNWFAADGWVAVLVVQIPDGQLTLPD